MPYDTRRKSLSLPSLGIQLPNTSRTHRSNASVACSASSTSATASSHVESKSQQHRHEYQTRRATTPSSSLSSTATGTKTSRSGASPSQTISPPAKRFKRSHSSDLSSAPLTPSDVQSHRAETPLTDYSERADAPEDEQKKALKLETEDPKDVEDLDKPTTTKRHARARASRTSSLSKSVSFVDRSHINNPVTTSPSGRHLDSSRTKSSHVPAGGSRPINAAYVDTPPPSPGSINRSIFHDSAHEKDDLIAGVIAQLSKTGNRPHLIRELAAVLSTTCDAVSSSANPSALLSSRLVAYLRRPCWSATSPCPLDKELTPTHPRKVYYFLTTIPRQEFPKDPLGAEETSEIRASGNPSAAASILLRNGVAGSIGGLKVGGKRIISPSISSASVDEDPDALDERTRQALSPSPEVDLSSHQTSPDDDEEDPVLPDHDQLDVNLASMSVDGLGQASHHTADFERLANVDASLCPGVSVSSGVIASSLAGHAEHAASPPLEIDEKEFTQTASNVRLRGISLDGCATDFPTDIPSIVLGTSTKVSQVNTTMDNDKTSTTGESSLNESCATSETAHAKESLVDAHSPAHLVVDEELKHACANQEAVETLFPSSHPLTLPRHLSPAIMFSSPGPQHGMTSLPRSANTSAQEPVSSVRDIASRAKARLLPESDLSIDMLPKSPTRQVSVFAASGLDKSDVEMEDGNGGVMARSKSRNDPTQNSGVNTIINDKDDHLKGNDAHTCVSVMGDTAFELTWASAAGSMEELDAPVNVEDMDDLFNAML